MRCYWHPKEYDIRGIDCPYCKHHADLHWHAKECPVCHVEELIGLMRTFLLGEGMTVDIVMQDSISGHAQQ